MKVVLILALLFVASAVGEIEWRKNWAFGCTFNSQALASVRMRASKCGPACWQNEACTHYTWTPPKDRRRAGTCVLRKGPIGKKDASETEDFASICGILRGSA